MVIDFIFILRFYLILTSLQMSTFYSICFPPNVITAQRNVIALCALLHLQRVLYRELYFEFTLLPPIGQAQVGHLPRGAGQTGKNKPTEIINSSNCATEPFKRSRSVCL